ncbi:MAG: ATP-binding protein [Streptosporangiaceae bacterium]
MAESVQIPTGTVTLLFTDIEGSTRLWEAEPGPMASALRHHDEIMRSAIESAGGYVFKTVGDSFCAAFRTAPAAVQAALTAQRAISARAWPTTRPVTVRMGLHSGVCEERDGDYFGPVVNRAARLEAAAHGGQVLVSGVTAELASDVRDISLRDLGLHRLKDLGRPEQVFQVEADGLETAFAPLATLDNPDLPNNLPSVLSAFVGRERELAEVRELARSSRLATLTGAGGSGKTRLALQAAAELLDGAGNGVWLAELAALTDGEQVAGAVAAALGLGEHSGPPSAGSVAAAIGSQDVLLVLDNCEHLIDASAKFCEHVIRHCPSARFLATSREPLGIDGERVYRVPSLSLPGDDAATAADLVASDAVRLFVERARAQNPGFILDDQSAPLVAALCRRLDGIPLALELAAARLSSMSLTHLTERLGQRFRLLTGGSRNALPRQQTLQAAVDWSFDLLTPAARETMARLSVFSGGFELEAAEEICATEAIDALDVTDLVGSLVDKSLVMADRTANSVRYRLLETIRQYAAQELLRSAGDAEVLRLRDRHADYYLAMAEAADVGLSGRSQGDWFRRLDLEWDNIRGAHAHLEAEQRIRDVLTLGAAVERFAVSRARTEVLTSLRRAVELPRNEPSIQLANALIATVKMMQFFSRSEASSLKVACQLADRALAMARTLGDKSAQARALSLLAGISYLSGDLESAHRQAVAASSLARQTGDIHLLGDTLGTLAIAASADDQRTIRLEALDCFRRCGDELLAATELHMIYGLDLHSGQLTAAQSHLEEAVALAEALRDEVRLYFFRSDLVILRLIQGRHADAEPEVRRCLLAVRRTGLVAGAAEVILGAACCAAWQGDHDRAARLHAAADTAIESAMGNRTIMWSEAEQQMRVREQGQLRELMVAGAYDAAYRAGRLLSPADAVELALGGTSRETPAGVVAGSR